MFNIGDNVKFNIDNRKHEGRIIEIISQNTVRFYNIDCNGYKILFVSETTLMN